MNNNKFKILSILLTLLLVFSISTTYAADHRLEKVDMEVYINQDGSARIKEVRLANLVEGTESFIIIDNLGKSQIKDFQVYENGEKFEYINNWNINASREDKAKKNSILTTSTGVELSWGIGEYGRHEYTLEYTITNFVKQLEDSQMIFWRFVNDGTNIPPEEVKITISSDYEFSEENQRIWGFGFDGDIQFENGKVVAKSNRPLSSNNYVTVLMKLPQGMFSTNDILNQSFQEIQDEAFVGSDYSEGVQEEGGDQQVKQPFSLMRTITRGFMTLVSMGLPILLFIFIFIKGAGTRSKKPQTFKRQYKEEYFRDYPYEGHFLDVYYIPYTMGAANFENLLTGFILKWINEDRIIAVEEEVGWVFKKDTTNLKFLNTSPIEHPLEDELFQMMLVAAGKNEILEEKEFTKWARSNVSKIDSWEKAIEEYSKNKLEDLGYLDVVDKKFLFFKIPNYELTEKGKTLETNIYKYINYLYDFSLLNEHEAINVRIWDNIMIWAGFLGLTAVVTKQFEKLYPNYTQETVYRGNTIFLTSHLARNIAQTKVSASSSRSSGFGGGTSIGGGGGSFGGGSGGGTR